MKSQTKILIEKWIASVSNKDVWENPSSSDFKDMKKQTAGPWFRFTADPKKKKVWVWDSGIIHFDAMKKLGIPWAQKDKYLLGTASLRNGKLVMLHSDEIDDWLKLYQKKMITKFGPDWSWLRTTDMSWLNVYVDCSRWLSGARNTMKMVNTSK